MAAAGKREIRSQPAELTTLISDDARQRFHAQIGLYLPKGFTNELFNYHDTVAYPEGFNPVRAGFPGESDILAYIRCGQNLLPDW
jgi:hypothetical protein